MFDGFLSLGNEEIINRERTAAYLRAFVPKLDVRCPATGLHNALGHAPYVDPVTDAAPWYRAANPDTADFYGLFPSTISGDEDSTRTLTVTELTDDGAVQSLPRHGSMEIRVRGNMYASTEAGLSAGMTWLRTVLDDQPCGGNNFNCEGRELNFFVTNPGAETEAEAIDRVAQYGRVRYRVEPLEGPRVVAKLGSRAVHAMEVEFILNAGVPWAFTFPTPVATTTGIVGATAAEVYCPPQTDAYDALVVDPQAPSVDRPPRPPQIDPVAMPASWMRYRMSIGTTYGERWGRLVPLITVTTGATAKRRLRVRFYRNGYEGDCDYEGEFYVSYIPANAILTINGLTRELHVEINGQEHPAGNLVIGSDGRPAAWPSLACNSSYDVVVDSDGDIGETQVLTEISIRE